MSENSMPSVARFEQFVKNRDYETACNELLEILTKLDHNFGGIQGIAFDYPAQFENIERKNGFILNSGSKPYLG